MSVSFWSTRMRSTDLRLEFEMAAKFEQIKSQNFERLPQISFERGCSKNEQFIERNNVCCYTENYSEKMSHVETPSGHTTTKPLPSNLTRNFFCQSLAEQLSFKACYVGLALSHISFQGRLLKQKEDPSWYIRAKKVLIYSVQIWQTQSTSLFKLPFQTGSIQTLRNQEGGQVGQAK